MRKIMVARVLFALVPRVTIGVFLSIFIYSFLTGATENTRVPATETIRQLIEPIFGNTLGSEISSISIRIFTILISFVIAQALYYFILDTARKLGYTDIYSLNRLHSHDGKNIHKYIEGELEDLSEKYDHSNTISPLESARARIIGHIVKLRNTSITNLFIGILIAIFGIVVLFSALLQIEQFSEYKKQYVKAETEKFPSEAQRVVEVTSRHFDTTGFLIIVLIPKLSITAFIQIFSYFFLSMYRSNQNDIKYFQNEITLIDSLATAVIVAQGAPSNIRLILTALSKNERNRVMKKGEKPIISTDEAEILRILTIASNANRDNYND